MLNKNISINFLPVAYSENQVLFDANKNIVDFIVKDCNLLFEKFLGLEKEYIIKNNASIVFSNFPEFFQEVINSLKSKNGDNNLIENIFYSFAKKEYLKIQINFIEGDLFYCFINEFKVEEPIENSFEKFFDIHLDILAIADVEGNFIKINKSWERALGFTIEELKGKKFFNFIHPDDIASTSEAVQKLMNKIDVIKFVNRYRTKDGNYRYFEWNATSDGKIIYATAHDITERVLLLEQLNKTIEDLKVSQSIAHVGSWTLDLRTERFKASEEALRIFGFNTDEEPTFQEVSSLFHPEDLPKVRMIFGEALQKVEPYEVEFRAFKKYTKEIVYILSRGKFETDSEGKPIRVVGINQDITQRRLMEDELRASEEKFRFLTENIKDVIWILDAETLRFTYVSPSVIHLRGNPAEKVINSSIFDTIKEENKIYSKKILDERMNEFLKDEEQGSKKFYIDEVEQIHNDGHIVWSEVITRYLRNPKTNKIEIHGVSRDITERKRKDDELKKYSLELEAKNQELLQTKIKMEEIIKEKDKFFSILAHDLKSPFSGLLGLTNVLSTKIDTLPVSEIFRYTKLISKSATHLDRLLNNLLEWAQLQRDMILYNPKKLSLYNVIENAMEIHRLFAENKGIKLSNNVDKNIFIYADENMMNTVFNNLISNSIKFTEKGGFVEVNTELDNDYIKIIVKDNGIGIPSEMQDKIFNLVDKTLRKGTEGELSTGLGLVLCKEYIEKHRGEISVKSEENKGTSFIIKMRNFNDF